MANEVKLEIYTLRIRESRSKEYLPLDNFFGEIDFLSFFQNYISSFDHQLEINENQKRSLKLDSDRLSILSEQRMISGIIESGDYGYESKIVNTLSGEEKYKRKVDDTEIKPFYFLIYLPKNDNKGFVILQRLGIYGIHSVFRNHLTDFFKSKYNDLQLDFNPFVSSNLAKSFIEKGNIKEFKLWKLQNQSRLTLLSKSLKMILRMAKTDHVYIRAFHPSQTVICISGMPSPFV